MSYINSDILLKNISISFDNQEIIKDFTFTIPDKKITCIIGPSGCGKTSLLNVISNLNKNYTGSVNIDHLDVGYIFQEDRLLPWETVYDNIALVKDIVDNDKIMSILDALELTSSKNKYPSQLSGGMCQRVSLARGFYYNPKILLLDEPFKSLDYDLKFKLLHFFATYYAENPFTVCSVTHDIDEALLLGHKITVLSKKPTKILKEFKIKTCPSKRSLQSEEHILLRSEIINLLT